MLYNKIMHYYIILCYVRRRPAVEGLSKFWAGVSKSKWIRESRSGLLVLRLLFPPMGLKSAYEPKPEISNYVKLNIGGSLFYTTVTTLSKLDSKLRDLVLSDSAIREPSESEGIKTILDSKLKESYSEGVV